MTGARRSSPGDHRDYDELAVGWALHTLEPDDEAAFARHLPGCERCARTVGETYEVMAMLATEQSEAEPSADLADRLRAATRQTEQVSGTPWPAENAARRAETHPRSSVVRLRARAGDVPVSRRWLLLAAAAVVIIGLGVGNVVQGVSLQHARTESAWQQQIVAALLDQGPATLAPMTAQRGRRVATVVTRAGQVQVVSDGLAVNDRQTSTYVLWGMGHGSPVALGAFDVSADRPQVPGLRPTRAAAGGFVTYGISLEPGRTAPRAPSDVVATGTGPG
jgi:anti-sigma factor RsiW